MCNKATIGGIAILFGILVSVGYPQTQESVHSKPKELFAYYLKPDPHRAHEMLIELLESEVFGDEQDYDQLDMDVAAYFFARTGGFETSISKEYIKLFERGNHNQRLFMLRVLQFCRDRAIKKILIAKLKTGRFPNEKKHFIKAFRQGFPLRIDIINDPIKSPDDLDFLWCEFVVTGDKRVIKKIIGVLYNENPTSLDNIIRETARWSLINQCRNHKRVLETCKEELPKSREPIQERLRSVLFFFEGQVTEQQRVEEAQNQKPVAGAHAWALGCSGLLWERNNDRHDLLSGNEDLNLRDIKDQKRLLSEWWGIDDRFDLLKTLFSLELEGHRSDFEQIGLFITNLSKEEYDKLLIESKDNKERLNRIQVAKTYYKKLGRKGILAWDFSRYICLCRWGYSAGYINEKEAWDMIMPVAVKLQKTFDSWAELGQNYLIGRDYWSYEHTQDTGYLLEDAYQRLIDMSSSPWNKYQWNMDLSN